MANCYEFLVKQKHQPISYCVLKEVEDGFEFEIKKVSKREVFKLLLDSGYFIEDITEEEFDNMSVEEQNEFFENEQIYYMDEYFDTISHPQIVENFETTIKSYFQHTFNIEIISNQQDKTIYKLTFQKGCKLTLESTMDIVNTQCDVWNTYQLQNEDSDFYLDTYML